MEKHHHKSDSKRHRHRRTTDEERLSHIRKKKSSHDKDEAEAYRSDTRYDEAIAASLKAYRDNLPDSPPGLLQEEVMPVSAFEEQIFQDRIGNEQRRILRDFRDNLVKKGMKKKLEDTTMKEVSIRVSQTPASWSEFIYQNRMDNIIQNIVIEMTKDTQEQFGSAYKITSRRDGELKKSVIMGGKYRGYEFCVQYNRTYVPNKILNMK